MKHCYVISLMTVLMGLLRIMGPARLQAQNPPPHSFTIVANAGSFTLNPGPISTTAAADVTINITVPGSISATTDIVDESGNGVGLGTFRVAGPNSYTATKTLSQTFVNNSPTLSFSYEFPAGTPAKPLPFYVNPTKPSPVTTSKGANEIKANVRFTQPVSSTFCDPVANARINFNFGDQTITFHKPNGKVTDNKRLIHPRVGELLSVSASNYNPLTDSIDVAYTFVDKNKEDQARFAGLLSPASTSAVSGTTTSTTATKSGSASATAGGGAPLLAGQLATLENFANFLDEYRTIPRKRSACQIEKDMEEILRQAQAAGLGNSASEWQAAGKALLTTDELKTKYEPVLNRIPVAYGIIINYTQLQFPPIQIDNADITNMTFNFYRNKKKTHTRQYSFGNSGGFKIDFSSGLARTNLIDYTYSTTVASGSSTTGGTSTSGTSGTATTGTSSTASQDIIIRRDEGSFRIGLVLLSHAYVRTGWRLLNVSLTGGFMIDNNIATRYLLGGSLLLGREQRVILSVGKAWGKVKRLDDGLKEGMPYTYGTGARTVPTKDVTESDWFFSLTFNLGSL